MKYFVIAVLLVILEILYFRIARLLNITDNPNHRSSHTKPTIRGGGVIFPVAVLVYSLLTGNASWYWVIGLSTISFVSFLDDILTLANRARLIVHVLSVGLLLYSLSILSFWPILLIVVVYILIIGTINAWNFMDGINGITVMYTFSVLIALYYFDIKFVFIDIGLISVVAISTAIFGFFNCRRNAVCFAGDVGSVSLSFILIYFILSLIIVTGNPIFVLLFAVYGVDSIMTIVYRLSKKENIFKAHRSHLYQLMANERKMPHLVVSVIYFIMQMVVNIILIAIMGLSFSTQCLIGVGVIVLLSAIYWIVRYILVEKVRVAL